MRRRAVRKVTAQKEDLIARLAAVLYDFLPLTSRAKNTVTFKSIFVESNVGKYIDVSLPKLQALEKGFIKLYRYHERLPQKIIRKVVPAAISYKKFIRKPLTRLQIEDLSAILFELSIDMRKELLEIELNETLPRIELPPKKLEEHLRNHGLDPKISSEPLQLFSDGHFNEAVRKAAERFEDFVQEVSNLESSGRELMANAFRDGTYINTSNIQPENQQGYIEGYKFLTMGTMSSIRNIFSHGDEERRSPEECFEMLLFINWLFRCMETVEEKQED